MNFLSRTSNPGGLCVCVCVFLWEKEKEREKQFILHVKAKGKMYNNVEGKLLCMGKKIYKKLIVEEGKNLSFLWFLQMSTKLIYLWSWNYILVSVSHLSYLENSFQLLTAKILSISWEK